VTGGRSLVRCDVSDFVAVVTIDDPDRRNAINAAMNDELLTLFDSLESRDDVRAVVVTGAPPAFCAGADLSVLRSAGDADGLRSIYAGFLRVASTSLPTVAAVNGAAVGAGVNMALACDVIVAGESARFDSRFLRIGIHPGGGHLWRLARKTSDQTARAMVLFGEVLDGVRAAELGLAWRCVPDASLLDDAVALARGACDAPHALVARTKETLDSLAAVTSPDAAVAAELEPQAWSTTTPEFADMLAKMKARISSR
jgi:enoyl-CoA hydratase